MPNSSIKGKKVIRRLRTKYDFTTTPKLCQANSEPLNRESSSSSKTQKQNDTLPTIPETSITDTSQKQEVSQNAGADSMNVSKIELLQVNTEDCNLESTDNHKVSQLVGNKSDLINVSKIKLLQVNSEDYNLASTDFRITYSVGTQSDSFDAPKKKLLQVNSEDCNLESTDYRMTHSVSAKSDSFDVPKDKLLQVNSEDCNLESTDYRMTHSVGTKSDSIDVPDLKFLQVNSEDCNSESTDNHKVSQLVATESDSMECPKLNFLQVDSQNCSLKSADIYNSQSSTDVNLTDFESLSVPETFHPDRVQDKDSIHTKTEILKALPLFRPFSLKSEVSIGDHEKSISCCLNHIIQSELDSVTIPEIFNVNVSLRHDIDSSTEDQPKTLLGTADGEDITDGKVEDKPKDLQARVTNLCSILDRLSVSMNENVQNFVASTCQLDSTLTCDSTSQTLNMDDDEYNEIANEIWSYVGDPSDDDILFNQIRPSLSWSEPSYEIVAPTSSRKSKSLVILEVTDDTADNKEVKRKRNKEMSMEKDSARRARLHIQRKTRLTGLVSPRKVITAKFWERFRFFSKTSATHKSGVVISKAKSIIWLKNAGFINDLLPEEQANDYFAFFAGKKIVMNIHEYVQYLQVLSYEKKIRIDDVIQRLSDCCPPVQGT